MSKYQIMREESGKASVSAFVGGKVFAADQNHPNFREILTGLASETLTDDQIRELFDVTFVIGQHFERLSDRMTTSNGRIYFDGEELNTTLTQQILRFLREGEEFMPLVNFFEKLATNPLDYSVQQLFDWLEHNRFTILPDGDVLAYKGVDSNFFSTNAGRAIVNGLYVEGKIQNLPGSIIEMPRSEVKFDPNGACMVGLHVATYGFAQGFSTIVVAVKVNPRDVVSVPRGEQVKMRVCRYEVLVKVDQEILDTVSALESARQDVEEDEGEYSASAIYGPLAEIDPELERLLAEEEEIERRTREHLAEEQDDEEIHPVLNITDPTGALQAIRNVISRFRR